MLLFITTIVNACIFSLSVPLKHQTSCKQIPLRFPQSLSSKAIIKNNLANLLTRPDWSSLLLQVDLLATKTQQSRLGIRHNEKKEILDEKSFKGKN